MITITPKIDCIIDDTKKEVKKAKRAFIKKIIIL